MGVESQPGSSKGETPVLGKEKKNVQLDKGINSFRFKGELHPTRPTSISYTQWLEKEGKKR